MEDLAGKIADLLNDPNIMKQVQSLSGLLGDNLEKKTDDESDKKEDTSEKTESDFSGLSPKMIKNIMKLAPLMASINTKDKYTDLLCALRPLLGPPRQKKLDEASKFLKLLKILPILKQQGIL